MKFFFREMKKYGSRHFFLLLVIRGPLRIKVFLYKYFLSDNAAIVRNSIITQPTQFVGKGKVEINGVSIGVWPSPNLFNGVSYFEVRSPEAELKIGNGTCINNNSVIIVDRTNITIGENCLIGPNLFITDSDFHGLRLENRNNGNYECKSVIIENNVFVGEGVRILKGVKIGCGAVIGSGSLVVKDVAPNTVVAGVPAREVLDLDIQPYL